jgi:predicted transposase YbfD/YdcC
VGHCLSLKSNLQRIKYRLVLHLPDPKVEPQVREIAVSDLRLDPDNPRFFHLKSLHGKEELTQEDLMKEMEEDDEIPTLAKTIKRSGVTDPIWVKQLHTGKYLVLEGNRRTYILNNLINEGEKPSAGVRYDRVRAHVYPPDAPETELILQKARLQAGKKVWGAFNVAAYTYALRYTHNMEEDDIAVELQTSIKEVVHSLQSFKMFKDYTVATKDTNPKKFSMFAEAPKRVWEWISESPKNLRSYYKLISPMDGRQKIRTVATRGGLRDFAKILDDKKALDELLNDSDVTVEDALEIASSNSIKIGLPFVSRIGTLANQLQALTDEQVAMLKTNKKVRLDIKRLDKACTDTLRKIGS